MENENKNENIEELCYYCDLSAFKSIMENQTLWLSDIHYMNDSSEESLFLDALEEVMDELWENLSDETKDYVLNDERMSLIFKNSKKVFKSLAYICCFSDGLKDDLSQWRGYADDGKGLCIGFKKEGIKQLSKNEKIKGIILYDKEDITTEKVTTKKVFEQHEIFYKEKTEIKDALNEILKPYVDEYDENIQKIINYEDDFEKDDVDDDLIIQVYSKTRLPKNFFKNESFISEKEYRICFYDMLHENALGKKNKYSLMKKMQEKYKFDKIAELSELKYRQGKGNLIPYRELKFDKKFFKDMISSITIGPKNRMSVEDVKFFLLANGFDTSNITIEKSASTYQ